MLPYHCVSPKKNNSTLKIFKIKLPTLKKDLSLSLHKSSKWV